MSLIAYLTNFKRHSDLITCLDAKTRFVHPSAFKRHDFRLIRAPLRKSSLVINLLDGYKYGNGTTKFINASLVGVRGSERVISSKSLSQEIIFQGIMAQADSIKATKVFLKSYSNQSNPCEPRAINAPLHQEIATVQPSCEAFVTKLPFWNKKLIEWILTAPNVYEFALTVLQNFCDICFQNPENKNFIDSSLIPRIRFMRFTISAAVSVVSHVAIGILFTPLVIGTLGRKESINLTWYSYWAEASLSTVGVFAGVFGTVTGNFLIEKTMQEYIPCCKNYLISCLSRIQSMRTEVNKVNINRLKADLNSVGTVDEMVVVLQELASIIKRASCKKP